MIAIASIITPVFNRSDLTSRFIDSVKDYLEPNNAELVIIDNNSLDNTREVVKFYQNFNEQIVYGPVYYNSGFGVGNNFGVSFSNELSKNFIFISNDVIVNGDFIKLIIDELKDDEIIGPRLISFPTGWNTYKESGTIPYIEGFCMAMTRRTFNRLGKWDESLFLDVEDLEYCYRAKSKRISLRQVDLPVEHHLGGSFSNLPKPRIEYTLESQSKFMAKYGLTK